LQLVRFIGDWYGGFLVMLSSKQVSYFSLGGPQVVGSFIVINIISLISYVF